MSKWPRYAPDPAKYHRWGLAYLWKRHLWEESGEYTKVKDLAHLCALVADRNLLVLGDALDWSPDDRLRGSSLNTIYMRFPGKRSHYLTPPGSWLTNEPTPDTLRTIRQAFTLAGVGTARSVVGLGATVMRDSWQGEPQWLPNASCLQAVKRNSSGQRVELFRTVPAWERFDLPSAYPNHARLLPTGTGVRLTGEVEMEEWFMECDVTIRRRLPLGPFPVRVPGDLAWPTEPGWYRTWLWKGHAEDTRRAGCTVTPRHGYGWSTMTDVLSSWVDRVLDMRRRAPSREAEALCKVSANAAIGCLGIGWERKALGKRGDGGAPVFLNGEPTELEITTTPGYPTPVHWNKYIEMQVGRAIYALALPYAQAAQLVAIETDCYKWAS
jgi:hypothetical protein